MLSSKDQKVQGTCQNRQSQLRRAFWGAPTAEAWVTAATMSTTPLGTASSGDTYGTPGGVGEPAPGGVVVKGSSVAGWVGVREPGPAVSMVSMVAAVVVVRACMRACVHLYICACACGEGGRLTTVLGLFLSRLERLLVPPLHLSVQRLHRRVVDGFGAAVLRPWARCVVGHFLRGLFELAIEVPPRRIRVAAQTLTRAHCRTRPRAGEVCECQCRPWVLCGVCIHATFVFGASRAVLATTAGLAGTTCPRLPMHMRPPAKKSLGRRCTMPPKGRKRWGRHAPRGRRHRHGHRHASL